MVLVCTWQCKLRLRRCSSWRSQWRTRWATCTRRPPSWRTLTGARGFLASRSLAPWQVSVPACTPVSMCFASLYRRKGPGVRPNTTAHTSLGASGSTSEMVKMCVLGHCPCMQEPVNLKGRASSGGKGCQTRALGLLALTCLTPSCMTAHSAYMACRLIGCVVQTPAWWLPFCGALFITVAMADTSACCACAATNHMLRRDKLRRAHRVIKEQKRLRHGGGTQGVGDFDEDILDV